MRKGFTLVELIAVIAILAIIITIAVPTLLNSIGNSNEKLLKKNKDIIVSAAKSYAIDYDVDIPSTIDLSDLCNTYLDCPIKNPVTNNNLDGCVKVEKQNDITKYTYIDNKSNC